MASTNRTTPAFYVGFNSLGPLYDYNLVKQDLLNHFNTRVGERVMEPNYGSIIWDMTFEHMNDNNRQLIIDDVKRIIAMEPRVELIGLDVREITNGYIVDCQLFYYEINLSDSLTLQFDLRNSGA